MSHLKRIRIPKSLPIRTKKGKKYIAKPIPGPHNLFDSVTLNTLLKEVTNHANTTKEVKSILNKGKVLVDGIIRKDYRFPIGLMDIISIPELNEYYIILYRNGKLSTISINKEDVTSKTCKIIGKTMLKGGKLQLNLYDGKNIIVKKDGYKVGDSVVISQKEIKKLLKLEKGAIVYLTDGKHQGSIGVLEELQHFQGITQDRAIIKSSNKKIITRKDYIFVIDKEYK